jgi:cytochrome c oxidase subunit II
VSGEQTRAERRAVLMEERHADRKRTHSTDNQAGARRRERLRKGAFGLIVVTVLAIGSYLAFGDFLGQRGATTTADAISVQSSMAGFGPPIHVKAGQAVTLDWWTNDAAAHLQGGVHTMISDELGLHEELPAAGPSGESRRLVAFTAPTETGEYDVYCDTCCGGKASPTMHGKIVVDEA